MQREPGPLLRSARMARGLNQAALARRAGTTQTYVSRIERGAVSPSLSTLERLFNAMGMTLELTPATLSPGNSSPHELRADLRERTASERLEEAMELSAFLTELAASGASERR